MEDALKNYTAGFAAGIATVITGHPFDTVKVRGLYNGATSSFVGMAFESSFLFGFYTQMKLALQGADLTNGKPKLGIVVPSAACGGALISFILGPAELVKLKGLYRGGVTTFLRESIGNAVFFSTYETTRYYTLLAFGIHSKAICDDDVRSLKVSRVSKFVIEAGAGILSGGLGGMAFWLAVLPLDVAKTRIQTNPHINANRNPLHELKLIFRQHGFKGLYAGLGPTLVRAFPANAAAIVTWELTANLLGVKRS